jgi:hypothetical protein
VLVTIASPRIPRRLQTPVHDSWLYLTDEQQIDAEDDYRICVRRGGEEEAKPKRKRRKMKRDDEHEEVS